MRGHKLSGQMLLGGGDWQAIGLSGLTEVNARYALKADDDTVIDVVNIGARAASEAVIARVARGEAVDPDAYYFRTSPRFTVGAGRQECLCRKIFARGFRMPDYLMIDFYAVG